ncbi:MAG TPA: hypothetical protein VGL77_00695 [Armatimonadota bacterium]
MDVDTPNVAKVRISPEVALIGTLLLLGGIQGAISGSESIAVTLTHRWEFQTGQLPVAVIRFLLSLATIAVSIGLLRAAPWGRRSTIVVLWGAVVFQLLSRSLLMIHEPFLRILRLARLTDALPYALYLLALSAPAFLASISVSCQRFFARLASYGRFLLTMTPAGLAPPADTDAVLLDRRTPSAPSYAALPVPLALVALLLCAWALADLNALWGSLPSSLQDLVNNQFSWKMPFLVLQIFVPMLGYLIAGIALLARASWARTLAVVVLWLGILSKLSPFLQLQAYLTPSLLLTSVGILLISLHIGLSVAVLVTVLVFLRRTPWPIQAATGAEQTTGVGDR